MSDELRARVATLEAALAGSVIVVADVKERTRARIAELEDRVTVLHKAVFTVVKRTPFVASATGITLEMPFATIKLLQEALKDAPKPAACGECGRTDGHHYARCSKGP